MVPLTGRMLNSVLIGLEKKIYRTGNLGEGRLQRVTVSVRKLKDEELINASEQWGGMIIAVLYLLYMVMMEARTQ